MKPSEIYKLPFTVWDSPHMSILDPLTDSWHRHLPMMDPEIDALSDLGLEPELRERFQVRIHVNDYIDGERCRVVGSLWFDQHPVMIFRHAGRSGHDSYDEFVTDSARFEKALDFLRSLIAGDNPTYRTVDPEKDIKELDFFYGEPMSDSKGPIKVACPDCKGEGAAGPGKDYCRTCMITGLVAREDLRHPTPIPRFEISLENPLGVFVIEVATSDDDALAIAEDYLYWVNSSNRACKPILRGMVPVGTSLSPGRLLVRVEPRESTGRLLVCMEPKESRDDQPVKGTP